MFLTTPKVFAFKDNEFYERTIRGTEIIHISLAKNSKSENVCDYIKKDINHDFDVSVSSTPSYNSNRNGSIHWYLKDGDEDLMAVYFDGGHREERDENYDFVDLRWLGNGSPHMYFFWKMDEPQKILGHNNILKAKHFKNTNPVLNFSIEKLEKKTNKNITVKKISKKEIQKLSGGNFFNYWYFWSY
ncbi:hypothetical protein ['Camptotheca acuminata' phytoplasma]|uniref:hypothetical protein n=1 Tax='Camptotheca acuminata' phytoplasma TaxID=3239192 RepID=UPI00351A04F1